MASQFDFSLVIETIFVATVRVLPDLKHKFGAAVVYDTVVALNPVVTASWITGFLVVMQVFLFALSGSFAWNDRLWSIIPPIYATLYAIHPVISLDRRTEASLDKRLSVMCFLVFIWGIRLTFNAARRGFYKSGFVDYRYQWIHDTIVKNRILFSLLYASCCLFLTILLALTTSPLYFAWVRRGLTPHLTYLDGLATVGMATCIAFEAVADRQQHDFQMKKAAWHRNPERRHHDSHDRDKSHPSKDMRDGFLQSGLFGYSRHPNFFAEVSTWWFFYIFSVSTSERWLNWAIIGPILYTLLFQATTPLTEHISSQKYPAYKHYQARVSRLIPLPFFSASPEDRRAEETKKTH